MEYPLTTPLYWQNQPREYAGLVRWKEPVNVDVSGLLRSSINPDGGAITTYQIHYLVPYARDKHACSGIRIYTNKTFYNIARKFA